MWISYSNDIGQMSPLYISGDYYIPKAYTDSDFLDG